MACSAKSMYEQKTIAFIAGNDKIKKVGVKNNRVNFPGAPSVWRGRIGNKGSTLDYCGL
jgi:hypothetical protein